MIAALLSLAPAARVLADSATPAWSDEFNQAVGSKPDSTKWTYDLGAGGWGNAELENYTSDAANASVVADPDATDGKALAITAVKSGSNYTSARIKTQGLFSTTYGRIEARLKLPTGQGIWPAFWMLGNNISQVGWPQCGEVDVMENIGSDSTKIFGTLHGPGYSGSSGIQGSYSLTGGATFSGGYHTFAVVWSPDKIQWLCDGNVYQTLTSSSIPAGTSWVYNNSPFFLILNLAVGGYWPGNPNSSTSFPQTYYVDYVRVYNLAPDAPAKVGAFANTTGSIDLSWSPCLYNGGSAISGYRVDRATDSAFSQNLLTVDVGNVTSYHDANVVAGTKYYYQVKTVTAAAVSSPSSAAIATAQSPSTGGGTASIMSVLSSRCFIGTGENIGVAGFWIKGDKPVTVLIRAAGPVLKAFGLTGYLPDPLLMLYDGSGNLLAANAGWGTAADPSLVSAATTKTGAGLVFPSGSLDAAIVVTLPPGGYSAQCMGAAGDTGVALIEVYQVP